jgi:uncharacterized protein (DUF885 family)
MLMNRREAVAALATSAALPLVAGCGSEPTSMTSSGNPDTDAVAVLDAVAENLLRLFPESATSLGIDTGARAALRSALADRSPQGRERLTSQIRADLEQIRSIDTTTLTHATRTSVEVVRSAYATALEGFALPYGDITVGSWRNTPYVVIQNVGAYLDIPRFLDAEHPIENAADAEAYLARLQSYPKQLDGELERLQAARAEGPRAAGLPDRQGARATAACREERARRRIARRVPRAAHEGHPRQLGRTRAHIAAQEVAPALERQVAELQAQRASPPATPGMWARPGGEEFYRWALKASTTTAMTPDEIHAVGQSELQQLHAEMDTILTGLGYTKGTVGERMKALAKDPRYQFAEGDTGRAEIMAFIQDRLAWIRAQLPRAFNTLVDPTMEVKRLPPEEEPGAPTAYGGAGSIDGKIPGRYWINLRRRTCTASSASPT